MDGSLIRDWRCISDINIPEDISLIDRISVQEHDIKNIVNQLSRINSDVILIPNNIVINIEKLKLYKLNFNNICLGFDLSYGT